MTFNWEAELRRTLGDKNRYIVKFDSQFEAELAIVEHDLQRAEANPLGSDPSKWAISLYDDKGEFINLLRYN